MGLSATGMRALGPPGERRYSHDHVWMDAGGYVGVTERLVRGLPRVDSIHLPAIGAAVRAAEPFAALEGDKGLLDVYAPCDGTVIEVNQPVAGDPQRLQDDPLGHWLVVIRGRPGALLSADAYAAGALALPIPHR